MRRGFGATGGVGGRTRSDKDNESTRALVFFMFCAGRCSTSFDAHAVIFLSFGAGPIYGPDSINTAARGRCIGAWFP